MTRTWFPEAHYMPYAGGYLPLHRWYVGEPFKQLPGKREPYPTVTQAKNAARDYMAGVMDARLRADRAYEETVNKPVTDLGREEWLQDRAGRAARDQQQVLGGFIHRGRQVTVEKRRIA